MPTGLHNIEASELVVQVSERLLEYNIDNTTVAIDNKMMLHTRLFTKNKQNKLQKDHFVLAPKKLRYLNNIQQPATVQAHVPYKPNKSNTCIIV